MVDSELESLTYLNGNGHESISLMSTADQKRIFFNHIAQKRFRDYKLINHCNDRT